MKKIIMGLVLTILFTAAAQAGQGPTIGDVDIDKSVEGLTEVSGTLVGVRFTKDDTQQIGCAVVAGAGGFLRVNCFARDINEDGYGCWSFDPVLIEAAKSISPYSYVVFKYDDATAECTRLAASIRSHHIPDKDTGKSKKKK